MKDHSGDGSNKIQLVCVGKAYAKTKEVCLIFLVVDSGGGTGHERIYGQKHLKHVRVGHLYEVETDSTEPSRIHTDTMRWLNVWHDAAQAATWQAAASAFDTLDLAQKHEKKETGRKLPLELLRPIRDEYLKTNAAGRLAIEVRVLAYLRLVKLNHEL